MPQGGANSERVLILAPHGRDAEVASNLLIEVGRYTYICTDLTHLSLELQKGAAFVVVTEEAIIDSDHSELSSWVKGQPPWSDIPIVLLTARGDSPERVERARRYQDHLGNVTYSWVPRARNARADRLASEAMDRGSPAGAGLGLAANSAGDAGGLADRKSVV